MISLSTVTVCALGYGLVLSYAVCKTLVFTHTERANALRSLHARRDPEVRIDVEFRLDIALAVVSAVGGDGLDAIEHQHRRGRQLGVARTEQLAAARGQQAFMIERRGVLGLAQG